MHRHWLYSSSPISQGRFQVYELSAFLFSFCFVRWHLPGLTSVKSSKLLSTALTFTSKQPRPLVKVFAFSYQQSSTKAVSFRPLYIFLPLIMSLVTIVVSPLLSLMARNSSPPLLRNLTSSDQPSWSPKSLRYRSQLLQQHNSLWWSAPHWARSGERASKDQAIVCHARVMFWLTVSRTAAASLQAKGVCTYRHWRSSLCVRMGPWLSKRLQTSILVSRHFPRCTNNVSYCYGKPAGSARRTIYFKTWSNSRKNKRVFDEPSTSKLASWNSVHQGRRR